MFKHADFVHFLIKEGMEKKLFNNNYKKYIEMIKKHFKAVDDLFFFHKTSIFHIFQHLFANNINISTFICN